MNFSVEYFHPRVQAEIESWPDGILADYARLIELLIEFGPNVKMPHSKAMVKGLFELRSKGREGIGRAFYCFLMGQRITPLSRNTSNTGTRAENRSETLQGE